jgi:Zn-dependent protease with chaperone function
VRKSASSAELQQKVLSAFNGNIEPVKTSISYRIGILAVTVVMLVLPLIYIGLIALVGYGVYYHMVNHAGIMTSVRGRGAILAVLVYLAPLAIGGILVLFMFKPLFSRPTRFQRRRSLVRENEPVLFAFVDRICEAVGAAKPKRIDVDCEVNASASFRRGMFSMLGSDLVLTIGMPLVAGLSMRQFGGVLAHEFGHFAQGAGMRLSYIVRSISYWFTRVVYQRDSWDDQLAGWAREIDLRVGWILYLAQIFVWLTRKVLWVLMMIGHAVGGYLLRQMEFDADRHEARLAGGDTFESTARQLGVLNLASQGAQSDLGDFYREGRLGDNLPKLIMANVEQLPPEAHEYLRKLAEESQTGPFDTHPADRDRIASAHRENAPGIFRLELPASNLILKFESLSQGVTWDFYREVLGDQLRREDLHPVDDLISRQGQEQEGHKALDRGWQGNYSVLRPLPLRAGYTLEAPPDPQACFARVKRARQQLVASGDSYRASFEPYDEADTRTVESDQAKALLSSDFKLKPDWFSVPLTSKDQVREVRRKADVQIRQLAPVLGSYEQIAVDRLLDALQLLHLGQVVRKLDDPQQLQRETGEVYSALVLVNGQCGCWLKLRNSYHALAILLNGLEGNEANAALINNIKNRMAGCLDQLRALREVLGRGDYPFDHAQADMSIGKYIVPELPTSDDLGAIYGASEKAIEMFGSLHARLVGRLCYIAEQVETALGMAPLAQPPAKG